MATLLKIRPFTVAIMASAILAAQAASAQPAQPRTAPQKRTTATQKAPTKTTTTPAKTSATAPQQKTAAAPQQKTATAPQQAPGGGSAAALAVVPENVIAFGVIRHLGELDEKIGTLARDLQVPAPGALMMVRTLAGIQEGLDEKGPLVVAFVPGAQAGEPPFPVIYVPVTDYKKFVTQLQGTDKEDEATQITIANQVFNAIKKGNHAVLVQPDRAENLKSLAATRAGALRLPQRAAEWANSHDAFLMVMPEGVKGAIGPVRQGLQQAKGAFPADNDQLKAVAAMFDVYDGILSTIEKEITHFAFGVRLDQGTIYLDTHSVFLANGSLAQAAGDAKRTEASALAALPTGPYVFAFDGVFPESWFAGMTRFSAEAMRIMATQGGGKPLTDEQVAQISDAMQKSMAGVQSIAFRLGTLQPGKSFYASMSGAMKVKNSREFMTAYEKSIREMSDSLSKSEIPLFKSYEITKANIGGVEALQVSMDMSGMLESAGGDPNAKKLMEMMIGEGGKITAYMAAADQTTIAIAYGEEALKATLASATKKAESFAAQKDVVSTQKLLPKDAQWTAYVSPNGVLAFAQTMMQNIAPGQPQLPPAPAMPPLGLAAKMTSQGCDTSLVLPKEVLVTISNYAQNLQQNLQPGGANGAPPPENR